MGVRKGRIGRISPVLGENGDHDTVYRMNLSYDDETHLNKDKSSTNEYVMDA